MSNDMELALRIRADLDQARKELRGFNTDLQTASGWTKLTRGELAKANTSIHEFAKANKAAAATSREAATGLAQEGAAVETVEKHTRAATRASREYDRAKRAQLATDRAVVNAARQLARGDVSGAGSTLLVGGGRGLIAGAGVATVAMTGLALAIGGVLKALHDVEARSIAFDQSLILTGGHVGKTREELAEFARELDALPNVTSRRAAAAIAQIGSTSQFAGEQFEIVTRAALLWSSSTKDSIDDVIANFLKIKKDPVDALLALNDQYNFLTKEQLERIRALVEEGREQEAVTQATRIYADMIETRAPRMAASLGTVASMLRGIKNLGAEAWDGIVNGIDRVATKLAQQSTGSIGTLIRALSGRRNLPDFSNVTSGTPVDSDAERRRQKAEEEWQRETQRHLSDRLKMEKEIVEARKLGLQAGKSEAEIETAIANIRKTYADREARRNRGSRKLTDEQRAEQAAQRELANLTRQAKLLGDLEDGERKATEAARIRHEISEGAYRLVTPALKEQLLEQARLLDIENMRIEASRKLVDVQLDIARLQGRGDQAEVDKARKELEKLEKQLREVGNAAGAADVAKLMNLQQVEVDLRAMQRTYDQVMGEIQIATQRIQLGVQSGLVTEAQAQRQIADLYRDKLVLLDALVPKMEAAAAALGNEEALANIQRIKLELDEMRATTDLLTQSIGNTFEGSFSRMVSTLATNTATLGEAVRQFFLDMAAGLAQFAAQQLAAMLKAAALRRFTQQADGNAVGEGAVKLTAAAAATAGAGAVIIQGATALQAAATQLMIANSMSVVGGFAEGGYTGHGGKYQLAGYVHRGEGVLNQDEIRALGGPQGFYALRDAIASGFLPRFSVPSISAPASPRYSFAEGGFANGELPVPQIHLRNVNVIDPKQVGDAYFDDPDNEATLFNWFSRNATQIKQVLG